MPQAPAEPSSPPDPAGVPPKRPPQAPAPALSQVRAPTLPIAGILDTEVLALNRAAAARMPGEVQVVRGASHLFEGARHALHGTLEAVVALARDWFAARIGWERSPP